MPEPEANLENTGERMIPEFHSGTLMYGEHYTRYLAALEIVQGRRVLDIASGSGYGSQMLAGVASSVVGVDVDKDAVAYAQERFAADNLTFLIGDGVQIPLEDDSVDVVVSFETIEHIADYRTFVSEVDRVLAPGGILVLSTPNDLEVPKGNHFHFHEFEYQELVDVVTPHFPQVVPYFQATYQAVMVGPEQMLLGTAPVSADIVNLASLGPDNMLFFYLICSREPVEAPVPTTLALAEHFSYRRQNQMITSFAQPFAQELGVERFVRQTAERRAAVAEEQVRRLAAERRAARTFPASVIVAVRDTVDQVAQALGVLAESTDPDLYDVVVVDMTQDPEVKALLKALDGDVTIVPGAAGIGIGAAMNLAAATARGETLIFMHDDVAPLAGWLGPLLEALDAPGAGVAGPLLISTGMTVVSAGHLLFSATTGDPRLGVANADVGLAWDSPRVRGRHERDSVSGALLAIRREVFDEVGGFDRNLRAGQHDVDLCLKVRRTGRTVVCDARSVVVHLDTDLQVLDADEINVDNQRLISTWADVYVPQILLGAHDEVTPNPRRRPSRPPFVAVPQQRDPEPAAARV
jgi:2-polyprenyl-3-methyl-5-hydroxy-6-metoxy-1,4-benzoquinol methylase